MLWSLPIWGFFFDIPFPADGGSYRKQLRCIWIPTLRPLRESSPSGERRTASADGEMDNRGRGRYRSRYRMDAGWDSDLRNRVTQPCCCGADTTRQAVGEGHEGQRPTGTGIDFDFDFDFDRSDRSDGSDGSATPRTPTRTRRILVYVNVYRFAVYVYVSGPSSRSSERIRRGSRRGRGGVFDLAFWGGFFRYTVSADQGNC